MNASLRFGSQQQIADLTSYLTAARRLDESGVVKLRVFGDVLAVYVSPIYSGSLLDDGPTILGLRTMRLAEQAEVDSSFEISALLERLASPSVSETLSLDLPAVTTRAAWTGITPPRQDWEAIGEIPQAQITQWAKDGIQEISETLPSSIGSAIAAKVRLGIWGRMVSLVYHLPAGAAFAMAGLGFMTKDEQIKVYQAKGWVRISSTHGHVICKESFRVV